MLLLEYCNPIVEVWKIDANGFLVFFVAETNKIVEFIKIFGGGIVVGENDFDECDM